MKVQKVTPGSFEGELHPAVILFRSIELKAIYLLLSRVIIRTPILDLGCGDGKISKLIFDTKLDFGLDNDEAGDVRQAIKKKVYKKVLIESAEKISLKNRTLNTIFSNSVIEHIPNLDAVLTEVSRLLKPKGKFIFTTPTKYFSRNLYLDKLLNSVGLSFLSKLYIQYRNRKLNHYHLYDHKKWRTLLAKHNMRITKTAYYLSSESTILWDKIALKVLLSKKLGISYGKTSQNFSTEIDKHFSKAKLSKTSGSCIIIVATKK